MYKPDNLVVAAAGSLEHEQVVELTRAAFGPALTGSAQPLPPRLLAPGVPGTAGTGIRLVSRGIEQANLVLGCGGLSRTDERRFALGVLNAALGGGMSSRLFQEVREKRGLATRCTASVRNTPIPSGACTRSACRQADEVLSICRDEIAKVISGGLTDDELDRGKGQLRGSIVLGLEDPSSRMSRLGKSELVYPRLEPVDEILAAIDLVTHDDVREVAASVLAQPKALAVVGPFDDADAASLGLILRRVRSTTLGCTSSGGHDDQGRGARRQGAHGV